MAEKYQESLDLFKKIYFKEDGTLDTDGYSQYSDDTTKYKELGLNNRSSGDYASKIVGRSAFTPRIIRKPIIKRDEYGIEEGIDGYKYFLTLDPQGKFDHHFDAFYLQNEENIQEIDVTDMDADDIMAKVEQMLNMSNEEIMTMFNIQRTYSTKVKVELLVDDVVQQYFEQQGQEITYDAYGPEWGINKSTGKASVGQQSCGYDPKEESIIYINPNGEYFLGENTDEISYRVLTPEELDISKIRIEIEEADVNSELGKLILKTLRERFTERQIEEEQIEPNTEQELEEKTGAEKIIDFMKQNNLGAHDLSLALTMILARTTDKTNAEQHIVSEANKETERSENNEHTLN